MMQFTSSRLPNLELQLTLSWKVGFEQNSLELFGIYRNYLPSSTLSLFNMAMGNGPFIDITIVCGTYNYN